MNSYTLKDIVLEKKGLLRGPFGGDLKKEIFVEKGKNTYKVYEQGVVLNSDKDIGRYYITEHDFLNKLNRFSVQDRDFLVSCSGVNNGAIYQLKAPFEKGIINQALLRIRLKNELIDDNYFYYLFKKLISRKITSGSGDSTIPNFPGLDVIKEIEFDLPDLKEQKVIGYLLSILDSKIELNNKINLELELMAKTLYNYWFVQFDFPNEKGKPYKTSGGKMVWNEELKKEIPEGWQVQQMNKLLKKNTEKFNFSLREYDIDTIDLSVMPSATMCLNEKSNSSSFYTNLFKLNKFDILFGGIRPYLLKAGFSPIDGLVTGTVHSFRVNDENEYNFVLITMVHDSMFKFAVSNSKGTKMPVVGADDLLNYKVAYNKEITKKFNEHISFKEIISHNIIENQKLAELRDWLLPMLMNSQIKVK
jgi:type I restriction enzyme, S subunit